MGRGPTSLLLCLPLLTLTAVADHDARARETIAEDIRATRPTVGAREARRMAGLLTEAARRHGLDPLLLAAVARVESAYDPAAISPVGARGLLQVMPGTARELLEKRGRTLAQLTDLHDPALSTELGASYFAWLTRRFDSVEHALLAYNRGPTGARRALASPRAKALVDGYPRLVLDQWRRLSGSERNALPGPAAARSEASDGGARKPRS